MKDKWFTWVFALSSRWRCLGYPSR